MWINKALVARTLIWLAAIAVPAQWLPAASCGCASSNNCCQKDGQSKCCCSPEKVKQGRCCCTRGRTAAANSCCGKTERDKVSSCTCGDNCMCGKTETPKPIIPPTESNSAVKVAGDSLSLVSLATVYEPQVSSRHNDKAFDAGHFAALELCISLCRFTL
jgi:hypothetical protein